MRSAAPAAPLFIAEHLHYSQSSAALSAPHWGRPLPPFDGSSEFTFGDHTVVVWKMEAAGIESSGVSHWQAFPALHIPATTTFFWHEQPYMNIQRGVGGIQMCKRDVGGGRQRRTHNVEGAWKAEGEVSFVGGGLSAAESLPWDE